MLVLIAGLAGLGWAVKLRLDEQSAESETKGPTRSVGPAPVQVATVAYGAVELKRTFSGTLEATAEFVVAPKVGGRIEKITVDLSDRIKRGQVVAELDDEEYTQAVAQAEADLLVANATIGEAESALKIAERELERVKTLRSDGVASEAQLDTAQADIVAKQAAVAVARARAQRAVATVEAAKIRKAYTQVTAAWTRKADEAGTNTVGATPDQPTDAGAEDDEDLYRVVAERYVDDGDTVSANTALLSIVKLDPITGVVHVSEKDYALLKPGQKVMLTTDAQPGQVFEGRIRRLAPVFQEASRQARVELRIANPKQLLKPGMFIRAEIVMDTARDAIIVPTDALAKRDGQLGVFVVDEQAKTVRWQGVALGIRQGNRVQVMGQGTERLRGARVVTLGQQLVKDGAAITIPEEANKVPGSQDAGQDVNTDKGSGQASTSPGQTSAGGAARKKSATAPTTAPVKAIAPPGDESPDAPAKQAPSTGGAS